MSAGAGPVTLTTDFGTRDAYVASMKGVILSRAPGAQLVDLSHAIPPQDVVAAALFIAEAARWFAAGTIHVVVVDPGVGTERAPIALQAREQYFIGPDNGVFSLVANNTPSLARVIEAQDIVLPNACATFNGRDVFAPAAAHLAKGGAVEALGDALGAPMVTLDLPAAELTPFGVLRGRVVRLDHFGNAITNLPCEALTAESVVNVANMRLGVSRTYGEVPEGAPLALVGSGGVEEVAVRNGSAGAALGLRAGDAVEVVPVAQDWRG